MWGLDPLAKKHRYYGQICKIYFTEQNVVTNKNIKILNLEKSTEETTIL